MSPGASFTQPSLGLGAAAAADTASCCCCSVRALVLPASSSRAAASSSVLRAIAMARWRILHAGSRQPLRLSIGLPPQHHTPAGCVRRLGRPAAQQLSHSMEWPLKIDGEAKLVRAMPAGARPHLTRRRQKWARVTERRCDRRIGSLQCD